MRPQRSTPLWRVALCLGGFLIAAVLWSGLRGLLHEADLRVTTIEATAGSLYVGGTLALVAGLGRGLDRRPLASIGLTRPRPAHLLTGAVVAAGTVVCLIGLGVLAGGFTIDLASIGEPGWAAVLDATLATILAMSAVAISEELVFRGYALQTLAERWPLWVATATSGIAFAAMHMFGVKTMPEAGAMTLSAVTVTALLVVARVITGSIWWAVAWHAVWNVLIASLGLYGSSPHAVQVSVDGPWWLVGPPGLVEASALVIAANAAATALLIIYAARRGQRLNWRQRLNSDP